MPSCGGTPMAARTAESSTEPAWQAEPVDAATPGRRASTSAPTRPTKFTLEVLGSRSAPVHDRLDVGAAPHVEGADPLGRMELVARYRQEVHAQIVDARRDLPGALRRVGVHERAGRVGDGRDLGDGLNRPDLVVGVHHADEDGVGSDGAPDLLGVDAAQAIDPDHRDLRAQSLEELERLQHGGVLYRARDEVVAPGPVGEEHALQRVVVGLGAAAREDDLVRCGPEERRYLAAGELHRCLGMGAGPVGV